TTPAAAREPANALTCERVATWTRPYKMVHKPINASDHSPAREHRMHARRRGQHRQPRMQRPPRVAKAASGRKAQTIGVRI
ncbi:MAG TPA: hypothetical protein VGM85_02110, partial [Paraburkholderia sp.]